jgi:hypothetical protein
LTIVGARAHPLIMYCEQPARNLVDSVGPVSGENVSAGVPPALCAPGGQPPRRAQALPGNLDEVLSWEEERVVQRDWTVACAGKWYQLDRQHEALSLAGRKVVVRTLRNGQVQLAYRGQKLKWRPLPGRPVRLQKIKPAKAIRKRRPPTASHPWRRPLLRVSRAVRFGPQDSGRPPLRSGLPASHRPNRRYKQTTSTNKRGHSPVSYQGDISKKF